MRLPFRNQIIVITLTILLAITNVAGFGSSDIPRNAWWDTMQRILPRDRGDPSDAPVVVVAIDDVSMGEILPWPWPRDYLASLIDLIDAHGASAIALDMLLLEPDVQSPRQQASRYRLQGLDDLANDLLALRDTDDRFAEIMREVPVVLPILGRSSIPSIESAATCNWNAPAVILDPPDLTLGMGLVNAEVPTAEFRHAARGLAAINIWPSDDFIVRRVPAAQHICGKPFLFLGADTIRVAQQELSSHITQNWSGLEIFLGAPDDPDTLRFPAEHDGSFWLHYGPLNSTSIAEADQTGELPTLDRYISAWEVLQPDFDRTRLDGKIVVISVISSGRIDERQSPLGQLIYGVEVQMQLIEMILDQNFLRRPSFIQIVELTTFLIAGVLISIAAPSISPGAGLSIMMFIFLGLFGGSLGAFRIGLLLDAGSLAFGLTIVSAIATSLSLFERDRSRLTAQANQAALLAELGAAARMQLSMLPPRRFVNERVDLVCHLEAARTVSGDFFDYELVDNDNLVLVVGDVSGKGVEASQFMVQCKTLLKSLVIRSTLPANFILKELNAEIFRENSEKMFVTICLGIINLKNMRFEYATAGHDTPILKQQGGQAKPLDRRGGPPLGLISEIEFAAGTIDLKQSEQVVFYTDGVTETMNERREFFEEERLLRCINNAREGLTSEELSSIIRDSVQAFSGSTENSDDITILVLTVGKPPANRPEGL